MPKWKIVEDKYPAWEMKAGAKRYSVVDSLGNVAYVTDNPDKADGFLTAMNTRTDVR